MLISGTVVSKLLNALLYVAYIPNHTRNGYLSSTRRSVQMKTKLIKLRDGAEQNEVVDEAALTQNTLVTLFPFQL